MAGVTIFKRNSKLKLTENFDLQEGFQCPCNYPDCFVIKLDFDHIKKLQRFRAKLGVPITVNSGYRCSRHNADVGGTTNSQHLISCATDIVAKGMDPEEVAMAAESFGFDGIGRYNTFTHIDSRGYYARWDKR